MLNFIIGFGFRLLAIDTRSCPSYPSLGRRNSFW